MPNRVLSILNADNGRYTITLNSEEVLLLITKIREIVKEEAYNTYRKKLSEEYMTRQEILDLFKISAAVLAKWDRLDFLVPVKVGGKTLYTKSDVMKLIRKREKNIRKRRKSS